MTNWKTLDHNCQLYILHQYVYISSLSDDIKDDTWFLVKYSGSASWKIYSSCKYHRLLIHNSVILTQICLHVIARLLRNILARFSVNVICLHIVLYQFLVPLREDVSIFLIFWSTNMCKVGEGKILTSH